MCTSPSWNPNAHALPPLRFDESSYRVWTPRTVSCRLSRICGIERGGEGGAPVTARELGVWHMGVWHMGVWHMGKRACEKSWVRDRIMGER